jgi:hypothetical protein
VTLTEKSGHLAWCALVALALARQDCGAFSPAQENLFLTRWLASALKQRRFSRDVAPDIEWLLKQGCQCEAGQQAELPCSCTGELSEQNDLVRPECRAAQCGRQWDLSLTGQPRCRF